MKNQFKSFWASSFFAAFSLLASAQDKGRRPDPAPGSIEPCKIEVTYDKTSHLIFPSAIRYVDLGSEYLTAGKAEDAQNVLRVKAAVRDFEPETNFSVITDDGRFYSFDAHYSPYPTILSFDLQSTEKTFYKSFGGDVHFEELGATSPSLAGLLLETIYKKDRRIVRHIESESFGIRFSLKGIYIHDGKYYFHLQLENRTNVPFGIDFMNFKIVDKIAAKRTVMQETLLKPLRSYIALDCVSGMSVQQNVLLLEQFTLADGKKLLIEIFEKNGGRKQTLTIKNSDLVNARLVTEMQLKF